jgi:hypothetical protein
MTKPTQYPLEHVEIKVLTHLRKVKAPNLPEEIGPYIHEHFDTVKTAVNSLIKKGCCRHQTDFTVMQIYGHSNAIVITEDGLQAISHIPNDES